MEIRLEDTGKRYNKEWIFRHIDLNLDNTNSYVIQGANGSGKSTLLQILAGVFMPSEGSIEYSIDGQKIDRDKIFKQVSIATPYLSVYETFTLKEALDFHFQFKDTVAGVDIRQIPEILYLQHALNKPIRAYSSGMKQRVKLGLAILSDTPLLLLDEPTSNLDKTAMKWYGQLIEKHSNNRLVIVCSNQQEAEYYFCNQQINVEDYK
tara:strand:- start:537 stop:1157 length:621 start_codon:yes stop_codon:yes gene_type:complete